MAYALDPEKKKAASKRAYELNPYRKKMASKKAYSNNKEKRKKGFCARYSKKACSILSHARKCYANSRAKKTAESRQRCELSEPSITVTSVYLKVLQERILCDAAVMQQVMTSFHEVNPSASEKIKKAVNGKIIAARLAAMKLIYKSLQVRKQQAGELLQSVRAIQKIELDRDFGEGLHTTYSEPYFTEAAYTVPASINQTALAVDEHGRCMTVDETDLSNSKSKRGEESNGENRSWKCSSLCKPLTQYEADTIVEMKNMFNDCTMRELRKRLDTCDMDCPNYHYCKKPESNELGGRLPAELRGHPLVCFLDSGCCSKLRILRSASVHYPVLRRFLRALYKALDSHNQVCDMDKALASGDFQSLLSVTGSDGFDSILSNSIDTKCSLGTDDTHTSPLRKPNLEAELLVNYADTILDYEKQIDDYPILPCISCEQLYTRKNVTCVKLTDDFDTNVWPLLKAFWQRANPDADEKQPLYMCNYCKTRIKRGNMPPRCVLNGLQLVPIPPELYKLDSLSKQLIQRAKCYQVVVRLNTYTAKVPTYNSLKACKGNMFFLPLPLEKTMKTLDQANADNMMEDGNAQECSLPDPELYIIVNGKPTKKQVVWRSLVNVNHVKAALEKLKAINWIYKNLDENCIDEIGKKAVIETVSSASSTVLEKATDEDIAGFQSYTIRNLDTQQVTGSDIEQYKLMNVKEDPINNRQKYLDVMCFPTLFPDGNFGKYHPRQGLSHAEYIKSRLYNKDSRFRKDPQFIFYELFQKEMREISSGVYNVLKKSSSVPQSVSSLLQRVDSCDEHLEANLSTVLQSVRGTKHYWYLKKSDLDCMFRNWGSPTFFVTLSCSEYESPDITQFLRKVNNVPSSYNIAKLCTEDPVSVSRKFSSKFHSFFQTVLVKGEVLGKVDHFYWKKEYQARGAPHYHMVLWINGAPVIGKDDPKKVIAWMEHYMTCFIPDSKTDPELHRLVTKYQAHKCSRYCRRRRRCGKTYVTYCRFGFPRETCERTTLHNVQERLKKRKKIYELQRSESEKRINDYNPLLLMLWKANQFVSESSLALAHYLSSYLTKAEKSAMQDVWEEVSNAKTVYHSLWSYALKQLRTRECGLYEACDLLRGDHLCEKSVTVKWVDVRMPHKRTRRLKNHSVLKDMETNDPESEKIFEEDIFSDYYPNRPDDLEDVCLYDFVANYDWYGRDLEGNRKYRKLTKPRLVNHYAYDPNKESQKEDYYYSLVLLFVPFRDEGADLLEENETAEEAFNRLLPDNDDCTSYHERLQNMLEARLAVRVINEARQAEDVQEEPENVPDDEPQLLGEARSAMDDLADMNVREPDALTLDERVVMLNADQRRVFERIRNHLFHQQRHETNQCQCDEIKPLNMFVSGVGGTGKSFLIETVKAQVEALWPSDGLTCAIAAPTGLAAFIIRGVTVHRLFLLPVEHDSKSAGYWSLPKGSHKVLKTLLRKVKLIVIDEVSMVSSLNLAYIHLRLEELFGGSEWFGSKNIMFVGDLLQLQPVNGKPVYEKITNKTISLKLGCTACPNIWKECVTYDELTINERQKNDKQFSSMLDCVRHGSPTEETLHTLEGRVITCSVQEKFNELQSSGQSPVCLFPTRKACEQFNVEMLNSLNTKVHEIDCIDEVDETQSMCKWHKKAAEQLKKLNSDCNNTAGLEAKLILAVGARVMLRRNIDTKAGLVNGAIGTVTAIAAHHITVKFDHLSESFDIEKVKGKFMVMKNYYVYRKQFPIILAYAVTIHKCQGLSLDCAIIDLSDSVFAPGMAYVALSRVRSLCGLHLVAFDQRSLKVSHSSLKEINRLRAAYREDLPLYPIPEPTKGRKRKLESTTNPDLPGPKKRCPRKGTTPKVVPEKRCSEAPPSESPSKKPRTENGSNAPTEKLWSFKYNPIDERWQQNACKALGLKFAGTNNVDSRGANDHPLTRPHCTKDILGDGNCLFRSISYIITGSEDSHIEVRNAIIEHMKKIPQWLLQKHIVGYSTIDEYVLKMGMDKANTWGTMAEIATLAELLKTNVFTYDTAQDNWHLVVPHQADGTLRYDEKVKGIYMRHLPNHYDVVLSRVRLQTCQDVSKPGAGKANEKPKDDVNNPLAASNSTISSPPNGSALRFFPVNIEWQREACRMLHLDFKRSSNVQYNTGEDVPLTVPKNTRRVQGDGNCLFRCFSYILTGEERQHEQIRRAVVDHMPQLPIQMMLVYIPSRYSSVQDYLVASRMNRPGVWGTEAEIATLAHLLQINIYAYSPRIRDWYAYMPTFNGNVLGVASTQRAIYIKNTCNNHFDPVRSVTV